MDTLTAARAQMEVSLGFHMIFAALGIGMPLLMIIAEGLYLRTRQEHYRQIARTWGKATALTFAIGAVSGTALSFELGLLWPRFMAFAGQIIGPAFALEGFVFFIEAIFLGLYLYGWEKLSPVAHWLTGIPVALSGLLSGIFVVAANAWMQNPVGFRVVNGQPVDISPTAPFQSPAWFEMALHSSLSCYIGTAFAVAGVYGINQLRGRRDAYQKAAMVIALAVGTFAALLMPISGDISAEHVAQFQPAKLAAMEAHFETSANAPLIIGGIPDPKTGQVHFAIKIPNLLSLLAKRDPNATVKGLNAYPEALRPNVMVAHFSFQIMVASAGALVALVAWFWYVRLRQRREPNRWLLRAIVAASPLGFIALECGWMVTEVGRQPWIIYGIMPTAMGVTPVQGVPATFFLFSVLYTGLGIALAILLRRLGPGRVRVADVAAQTITADDETALPQAEREVIHA